MKSFLNRKINYKNLQYYQNCDSINKFNLTSSYSKPFLKNLIVEMPIKALQDALKFSKLKSYNKKNIESLSFLIFYLFSQQTPHVFFKTIKPGNRSSSYKHTFFFKINLNSSFLTYSFLQNIMYNLSEKSQVVLKQKECLTFINKYPIYNFFELENIFTKRFKNINLKDLVFFFKINFSKVPENLKTQKNFLRNFLF